MNKDQVGNAATKDVGLAEVAEAFGVSPSALERQLALLGWGIVVNEGQRLACSEAFGTVTQHSVFRDASGGLAGMDIPMKWQHLRAAFQRLLPELTNTNSPKVREPKDKREGVVYVLHDGVTGLSKIGCTAGEGRRQRAQMASHGTVLVNLLNAKVADMRAAEAQCHAYFSKYRRNGEWFDAPLDEILTYIASEINWLEIDRENDARLVQYFAACRLGDAKAAKAALTEPNHPLAPEASLIMVRTDVAES